VQLAQVSAVPGQEILHVGHVLVADVVDAAEEAEERDGDSGMVPRKVKKPEIL